MYYNRVRAFLERKVIIVNNTGLPDSTEGALQGYDMQVPYNGGIASRTNITTNNEIERDYVIFTAVFRTQSDDYLASYVIGRYDVAFSDQLNDSAEFNNELLAFSTKNDNQNDIPTMTLRLTGERNWLNLLSSNDYVELNASIWGDGLKGTGGPIISQVLMTGMVAEVNWAVDASSNTMNYIVTCQGLAKILSNINLTTFTEVVANGGYLIQDASAGDTSASTIGGDELGDSDDEGDN